MIYVALLGFGCVGSGVADVLSENCDIIAGRLKSRCQIKYILDRREFPDSPFGHLVVHDFNTILEDDEVSIVAEMMGGSHPAYEFTKACLEAGKSVVTSNKEVVSRFGIELCRIARENNVKYLFEASVAGGIPVIRPIMADISSNRINKISGILNGTTNYILTAMRDKSKDFSEALAEAQKKGYAEADPSADVGGLDTARKVVILGALASGRMASVEDIYVEGIEGVTIEHIEAAELLGYSIKLIGSCEIFDNKMLAYVAPMFVPKSNPLGSVDDVFNGVLVNANMLGDVMFYGPGAGRLPTASAVVADIVNAAGKEGALSSCLMWEAASQNELHSMDEAGFSRIIISDKELSELSIVGRVESRYAYFVTGLKECEVKAKLERYSAELGARVTSYRIFSR